MTESDGLQLAERNESRRLLARRLDAEQRAQRAHHGESSGTRFIVFSCFFFNSPSPALFFPFFLYFSFISVFGQFCLKTTFFNEHTSWYKFFTLHLTAFFLVSKKSFLRVCAESCSVQPLSFIARCTRPKEFEPTNTPTWRYSGISVHRPLCLFAFSLFSLFLF